MGGNLGGIQVFNSLEYLPKTSKFFMFFDKTDLIVNIFKS